MRSTYVSAVALLTLAFLLSAFRVEAQGLLHRHGHGDCDNAQQTTVTLPAQQIRIQTARPQVIVNDVSGGGHHLRARGYFPTAGMMPMVNSPFVATFATGMTFHPATVGFGAPTGGSTALDAIHALERQHLEFVKHKAALKAEMEHTDKAIQRVQGSISASLQSSGSSDLSEVNANLQKLSNRLDAIEKLLIIHDNLLKEKK
jgi:hypothetical protein